MPFEVTEHLAVLQDAQEHKDNSLVATAILNIVKCLFGHQYSKFMKETPSMQDLEVLLEELLGEYGIGSTEASD